MNSHKTILDLCGGTGSWSRPYKEASYDVRVITLPEYDVLDIDFKEPGETIEFYNNNEKILNTVYVTDVYGILAAPVCTMFSLARTTAKTPRDFNEGMKLVKKCLEIIWFCRAHKYSNLKFWALENPKGFLRQFLGKPAFEFKQWEFGDFGIKPTDIWGYFNIPTKTVTVRPEGLSRKFPNGRVNGSKWSCSAERRSITPPGFAKAFFNANQ